MPGTVQAYSPTQAIGPVCHAGAGTLPPLGWFVIKIYLEFGAGPTLLGRPWSGEAMPVLISTILNKL